MAPVEWTRLHGPQVEDLVATMLLRRHPDGSRIRPSRGDGGVDVKTPVEAGGNIVTGVVDVWQIKAFAETLTAVQKRQIKKSLDTVVAEVKAGRLRVRRWHLVLPLDPTRENEAWLEELGEGAPFEVKWEGLWFVDGLAAEFPDVVDYFVGDGRQRLQDAVGELSGVLRLHDRGGRGDNGEPLNIQHVRDDLARIHAALNRYDPHFRFDYALAGQRLGPGQADREGLVVFVEREIGDSTWLQVWVIARYAEAPLDRPTPLVLTPRLEPGSPEHTAFLDFLRFGLPARDIPAHIAIELPAGLGTVGVGTMSVLPLPDDADRPYRLRLRTEDQDGAVLGEAHLRMEPVTRGVDGSGIRAFGTEQHGAFTYEMRTLRDGQTTVSFSLEDLTGKTPQDVRAGIAFLVSLASAEHIRVAQAAGPYRLDLEPLPIAGILAPEMIDEMSRVLLTVETLARIQEQVHQQIHIPDLTTVVGRDVGQWQEAADLFEGRTVTRYWESWTVTLDPDGAEQIIRQDACALGLLADEAEVRVGDQVIPFPGKVWLQRNVRVDPNRPPETGDDGQVSVHLVPAVFDGEPGDGRGRTTMTLMRDGVDARQPAAPRPE